MQRDFDKVKGRKVLIVGLGRSGIASCHEMVNLGAEVYVQDKRREDSFDPGLMSFIKQRGIRCFFGCEPEDMDMFDMIILSPGVSPELPFIARGRAAGAEITGELEIAYRVAEGKFVAISGTNGKTTTTTLVGEIFRASGRRTAVVGNIGRAAIPAAVSSDEDTWLITEVSSFQLETTRYFRPVISALLNIAPDHLDRHHSMEAYAAAKAKIFANQGRDDILIVNGDDRLCMELAGQAGCRVVTFSRRGKPDVGAFLDGGRIVVRKDAREAEICRKEDLRIIGDHNVENVLAASAICCFAGIDPVTIGDTVRAFRGVEHRVEYCGTVDGVRYYNDSKGTNIDAALTAVRAIERNIWLIAGGDAKGQVFDRFIEGIRGCVKGLILMGRDAGLISGAADRQGFCDYVYCGDMPACVAYAHSHAEAGDTVLLSPACASWDMYSDYEQRGRHFKECVRGLER